MSVRIRLATRTASRVVGDVALGGEGEQVPAGDYVADYLARETGGGFGREYYIFDLPSGERRAVKVGDCEVIAPQAG